MPKIRPQQLLEDGNYIRLAKSSVDPAYQGIGALLVGNHRDGLAKLQNAVPSDLTRYYQAFGYWCLNDLDAANLLLNPENTRHNRFKEIINRKVRVLCQARNDGDVAWSISSELKKNPAFEVVTMGNMAMDDIKLGINEDIDSVLAKLGGWKPDFYFGHMIEYRVVPIGIERAPFPVIFQSSDHRADYQQVIPLLNLCDGMMVLGESPHQELFRVAKSRVFTYPKLFGIHFETAVKEMAPDKDFDVFWSGNMLDESLYDKATFFSHVVDRFENDHKLALCNGKTSLEEYYYLLSRAKIVPSYIHREQDSFSSRALEAIAMGATTLVPSGNAIGLYFDASSGLIEFHPANASSTIRNVLDNWDAVYSRSAHNGRLQALADFNFPDVVSQLFKFLLFESLNMPLENREPVSELHSQYRLYSRIESSEVYMDPNRMIEYKTDSLRRMEGVAQDSCDTDLLSAISHLAWGTGQHKKSIETLEKMYANAPNHFGVLFNLGYTYFYTSQYGEAKSMFKKIIALEPEETEISPQFTLFDSSSQVYLTHMMRDELCEYFYGGAPINGPLSYMKSVTHNFLANYYEIEGDMNNAHHEFRNAVTCYPDNFIAQANLGRFLLRNSRELGDVKDEAFDALVSAIELYRGYLLTDVFDLMLEASSENSEISDLLRSSQGRLSKLIMDGQQLHTKGKDFWLDVFSAESESKAGIRSLGIAKPILVESGFKGFNIVQYGSRFFALAQAAGPIDLLSLNDEDITSLINRGHCQVAESIEDIKNGLSQHDSMIKANKLIMTLMDSLDRGDIAATNDAIALIQDQAAQDPVLANVLVPMLEEISKIAIN